MNSCVFSAAESNVYPLSQLLLLRWGLAIVVSYHVPNGLCTGMGGTCVTCVTCVGCAAMKWRAGGGSPESTRCDTGKHQCFCGRDKKNILFD